MACNCNSCEECETCGNCSSDCESTSCDELQTSLANTADKINYLAVFKNVPAPLLRDTLLKLECDLASLATMVCEGGATTIDWSSVTEKPFDSLNPDDFTVSDGVLNIGGDLADPVTIEDVDTLPSPPDGDSNTFYRLPDGTVYVLNQIGDGWVDLTGGGSDINPDDFQGYKLTNDDGSSVKTDELETVPASLEEWARMYRGFFYVPNADLITMSDFDTLPDVFSASHIHMVVQSDSDTAYALQTITQCQAPYIQMYRVVTSTSAARWQVVVTSEMLDGTLEVPVVPTIATTLPHELDKIDQILNDIEGVIEDDE